MTHDPFCPGPKCARLAPFGECFGYEDCNHCQCSFIAKIRADEREQAALKVRHAVQQYSGEKYGWLIKDEYDCCGCSTYDLIVEAAVKAVENTK